MNYEPLGYVWVLLNEGFVVAVFSDEEAKDEAVAEYFAIFGAEANLSSVREPVYG